MTKLCQNQALCSFVRFLVLSIFLVTPSAQGQISFENLDEVNEAQEGGRTEKKSPKKKAKRVKKKRSSQIADRSGKVPAGARKSALPSIDELVDAKTSALKEKQEELEVEINAAEISLEREQALQDKTFDNSAYFSLNIVNNLPSERYRISDLEVFADGFMKPLAKGRSYYQGMTKNSLLFQGPIKPGCHDIEVRLNVTRTRNTLIDIFKNIDRVVKVRKSQAFLAKDGYRVEMEIELFEKRNSLATFFAEPLARFNRSVRPNFLQGAAMVSMDDVLKQGRARISYVMEDNSQHELVSKSLGIDGLPILTAEKHDAKKEGTLVFDAPLSEGRHRLNASLIFGEKKRVRGGPSFNVKLDFDRDFLVRSGHVSEIFLTGMPKGGFRSTPQNSRYAKVKSVVLSEENRDFFPELTCKELKNKQLEAERRAAQAAKQRAQPSVASEQNNTLENEKFGSQSESEKVNSEESKPQSSESAGDNKNDSENSNEEKQGE